MDIQTRKLAFIEEFLKIQSTDILSQLEEILKKQQNTSEFLVEDSSVEEQLNQRVEQSELDFEHKRFKNTSELLARYQS
uniref:hypothetical protein n=1 Tax=Flavobacterium sp. TaxID=239 RepID=UPI00404A185B